MSFHEIRNYLVRLITGMPFCMEDERKTKEQLIKELQALRQKCNATESFTQSKAEDVEVGIDASVPSLTKENKVERELRLYKNIIEYMSVGIMTLRLENRADKYSFHINSVNEAAAKASQTEVKAVLGKRLTEAFPTVEEYGLLELYYDWCQKGEGYQKFPNFSYEDEKMGEGNIYKFEAMYLGDNHVGVFYENITDREKTDKKLKMSEARFREMADSMPQLVWTCLANGPCDYLSKQWVEYTGIPEEPQLGYGWLGQLHPDDRERTIEEWGKKVIDGTDFDIQFRIRDASGEYHQFLTRAVPMRDNSGKIVKWLGSNTDINALKLIEEELKKVSKDMTLARNQAEEANRAKSQFLAMMSHEIRTPMNGVLGTAQLLAKTNLDAKQEKYSNILLNSGQQLLYVINDILDYSKLEANKLEIQNEPFSLVDTIQEVVSVMTSLAGEKEIKLSVEMDTGLPLMMLGDTLRIKQILSNLISNGIKFTECGSVSISVKVASQNGANVKLVFNVKDTGMGISEENIPGLFKEFSQVDSSLTRSIEGTGLGLSICQKLIHLMDGEINIESQLGVGSNFIFTLSFVEVTGTQLNTEKIPELNIGDLRDNQTRILLVEDNEINQIIASDMLEELGCVFDLACNGEEALTKLEKASYDLILMDIHMPIMDGFQATKYIIKKYPNESRPAIVALTADAMSGDKEKCIALGMSDYLTKPINMNELKSMLNKYCHPSL